MTDRKLTTLRDERGHPLSNVALKRLMGLPSKLPPWSIPAQFIRGALVWVEPAPAPVYIERWGKTVKKHVAKHRVMCKCPDCGKTVPAGRLAQHKCPPPPESYVDYDGRRVWPSDTRANRRLEG